MENEEIEQRRELPVLSDQAQGELSYIKKGQSDIQVYKEILTQKFARAETTEECEKLISLRQKVQALDTEERRLDFAQKSAEVQLKEAQTRLRFELGQQAIASLASISIGMYLFLFQPSPLAALLFLILGLAKPLGYTLKEVANLSNNLRGFPKKDPEDNSSSQELQDD